MKRRQALTLGLGASAWMTSHSDAATATVKLIVPFAAGGTSDQVARLVAHHLAGAIEREVIVESVTGAGGAIAVQKVLSAADADMILVASSGDSVFTPLMNRFAGYEPSDLQLLMAPISVPMALYCRPGLGVRSAAELLDLVQRSEHGLSCGNAGLGSASHVVALHWEKLTRSTLVHVPYRGGAPLFSAMMSDQVDLAFAAAAGPLLEWVARGRLILLGLTASTPTPAAPTAPLLPNIPTLAGFEHHGWTSLALPRSVPAAQAQRLSQQLQQILQSPEVQRIVQQWGAHAPKPMSLASIQDAYANEVAAARKLLRDLNLLQAG
jgi:tripartite-type tricarboxylate transporter receptor subunit TctC